MKEKIEALKDLSIALAEVAKAKKITKTETVEYGDYETGKAIDRLAEMGRRLAERIEAEINGGEIKISDSERSSFEWNSRQQKEEIERLKKDLARYQKMIDCSPGKAADPKKTEPDSGTSETPGNPIF